MANVATSFKKFANRVEVGDYIGFEGWDAISMRVFETVSKVVEIDTDHSQTPPKRGFSSEDGEFWSVDDTRLVRQYHVLASPEPTPDPLADLLTKIQNFMVSSVSFQFPADRIQGVADIVDEWLAEEDRPLVCGAKMTKPVAVIYDAMMVEIDAKDHRSDDKDARHRIAAHAASAWEDALEAKATTR